MFGVTTQLKLQDGERCTVSSLLCSMQQQYPVGHESSGFVHSISISGCNTSAAECPMVSVLPWLLQFGATSMGFPRDRAFLGVARQTLMAAVQALSGVLYFTFRCKDTLFPQFLLQRVVLHRFWYTFYCHLLLGTVQELGRKFCH